VTGPTTAPPAATQHPRADPETLPKRIVAIHKPAADHKTASASGWAGSTWPANRSSQLAGDALRSARWLDRPVVVEPALDHRGRAGITPEEHCRPVRAVAGASMVESRLWRICSTSGCSARPGSRRDDRVFCAAGAHLCGAVSANDSKPLASLSN
jgi:hypothetical protein